MAKSRAVKQLGKRLGKMHTDTVHLLRPVASTGVYGEQLNEYAIMESWPGRVIGLRVKDYEDYGLQEGSTTQYRVSLPQAVSVGAGDLLEVNGTRMDVIGVDTLLTDGADKQVIVAVRNG